VLYCSRIMVNQVCRRPRKNKANARMDREGQGQDGAWYAPYYCDHLNLVSGVARANWFARVLRTDKTVVRARSNKFGRATQSQASWRDGSPLLAWTEHYECAKRTQFAERGTGLPAPLAELGSFAQRLAGGVASGGKTAKMAADGTGIATLDKENR
jgi:hypothetical protein